MTSEQVLLVQASWAKVVSRQESIASLFYERLFEKYPETKSLFKTDIQQLGKKLMIMLDMAIMTLDTPDALIEPLKLSGKAHKGYGVAAEDYAKIGDALLWSLETGLGESFNEEVRAAWVSLYETVSELMIGGAAYEE